MTPPWLAKGNSLLRSRASQNEMGLHQPDKLTSEHRRYRDLKEYKSAPFRLRRQQLGFLTRKEEYKRQSRPTGPRLKGEDGSSSDSSLSGTGFNIGHGSSGTNMFSQARGPMTLLLHHLNKEQARKTFSWPSISARCCERNSNQELTKHECLKPEHQIWPARVHHLRTQTKHKPPSRTQEVMHRNVTQSQSSRQPQRNRQCFLPRGL